jgi:hypothetical protein
VVVCVGVCVLTPGEAGSVSSAFNVITYSH